MMPVPNYVSAMPEIAQIDFTFISPGSIFRSG
jgi:hypothetical protein